MLRPMGEDRSLEARVSALESEVRQLRAELLRREDRVRSDLLRAQAEKYPGEYRSLVEAYLRRLGANE